MSASSINYTQATQVAAIAIAVAFVPPVGVFSAIASIALGVIGYFGIEIADKLKEDCKVIYDSRLHRVVRLQRFSPRNQKEDFKNAIERFRKEKAHDLWPGKAFSLKEECASFQTFVNAGCCYGAVSALFDGIEKKGLSIEQSASAISVEEVFFRQLMQLPMMMIKIHEKKTNLQIQALENERAAIQNLIQCVYISDDAMSKEMEEAFKNYDKMLVILKERIKGYADEKTPLKEVDPLLSPSFSSRKFPPEIPCHSYQHILEKTIPTNTVAIRGTVSISHLHVMAFQYSSEGYYIYDSFSSMTGGLLKYSDKNSFFKKLRALVLDLISFAKKKATSPKTEANPENLNVDFDLFQISATDVLNKKLQKVRSKKVQVSFRVISTF